MRDDTKLVAEGRDPERYFGVVNPPVFRASTILYPDVEAFEAPRQVRGVYYGRGGTPTTFALEDAIAALEGAHGAVLTGSGKTAIAQALMTFLKAGDHLLMVDPPMRRPGSCATGCSAASGSRPPTTTR